MRPITITVEGVDRLSGLNPSEAQGPDQIELHSEIAPILAHIFRLSLETGIMPVLEKCNNSPSIQKGSQIKSQQLQANIP
jgi:hypothetical protein